MALDTVAVLLPHRTAPFEFGLLYEVFGLDRTEAGVPPTDFRVCAVDPTAPISFGVLGMTITATHGLDGLDGADLVAIPAYPTGDVADPVLIDAVRRAHAAGATLLTVCSGVFLLGAAGLLDGRECTTHWRHAEQLAAENPTAKVDPDVLFVDTGDIITSAGTAAGIDACLHLVRRERGSAIASVIARRMVVPPQRDGGQRQFVALPIPECSADSLAPVLDHVRERLDAEHSVASMARLAGLSERTFARRFTAETGTSPAKWLVAQRLFHARELLESTVLSVEEVARRSGFGAAAGLRHHFVREVGLSPADYRRRFATAAS